MLPDHQLAMASMGRREASSRQSPDSAVDRRSSRGGGSKTAVHRWETGAIALRIQQAHAAAVSENVDQRYARTTYRTAYLHFQLNNCGADILAVAGSEAIIQAPPTTIRSSTGADLPVGSEPRRFERKPRSSDNLAPPILDSVED